LIFQGFPVAFVIGSSIHKKLRIVSQLWLP
jgi:hypothetical protein